MRNSLLFLTCAIGMAGLTQSWAQTDFPSRPIRLVVSSAAGGTGDTMARAVSRLVERGLNGSIVVDNRPGASGIIAAQIVARAEPNGYTLLHTSSQLVTNVATGRKLPYDVNKDFVSVGNIATAEGYLVLVNAGLGVNSVKELIEAAKTRTLSYGSPGLGNPIHFTTAAFNLRSGTTMTHVPYKGLAPALTAVVSGEIQVLFAPPIATRAFIESGKLRVLASVSSERISSMPAVPTMEELGFKGFTFIGGWQAWMAPAGTPPAILAKLHGAMTEAAGSDELRAFIRGGGYVPDGRGQKEFHVQMMSDLKLFKALAQKANIKVE